MQVSICGVRGSTPSPGAEFVRYGGHTSCVAVTAPGEERPALVLDAGTGLRELSRVLGGEAFRGTILLGHLHWDHTHGIPFFPAGDRPDSRVSILLPEQGSTARDVLARVMSPPHFPIMPWELRGDWSFGCIDEGTHSLEGLTVLAREIPHKGGRTFGFRITDATGASMAYLSDHSPNNFGPGPEGFGEYHQAAIDLVDGVDLLIHDSQYTAAEFPARAHFGHSAIDYTVHLAEQCGVGQLLLYHHDPPRTDNQLDAIVASLADASVPVTAAAQGMVLEVGS